MIDQPEFALLSGSSELACLTTGEFGLVVDTLQQRLLNALCMTEPPADDDDNILLWNQLLADALAVSVNVKNDDGIQSESMRNYSYTFRDWANSWNVLAKKSGDLLNVFNACDTGIIFQTDLSARIYGHNHPCGGCGYCDECI